MGQCRRVLQINDETLEQVEELASRGLIMEEIALSLGISKTQLYKKKAENKKFSDAIESGRAKGIAQVANALYKKAVAGDNVAAIFYLKARAGWRDSQQVDHVSTDGSMSPKEPVSIDAKMVSALVDKLCN